MKIRRTLIAMLFAFLACLACIGEWAQTGNPYGIYPVPHSTQTTDQTAIVTEMV